MWNKISFNSCITASVWLKYCTYSVKCQIINQLILLYRDKVHWLINLKEIFCQLYFYQLINFINEFLLLKS